MIWREAEAVRLRIVQLGGEASLEHHARTYGESGYEVIVSAPWEGVVSDMTTAKFWINRLEERARDRANHTVKGS